MAMAKKREFSGFSLEEALELLGVENIHTWDIPHQEQEPSDFFRERFRRLELVFDTTLSEMAKQMVIEVIFEEVALSYPKLKIFKEVPLRGETAGGFVDYLIASQRVLPKTPLLCVAEAKKDNFEKGMAQCLVEMMVCAERNAADGKLQETYGIVTNGTGWQFYKREVSGAVWQSGAYGLTTTERLLGALSYVLALCEENV